jgi:hypothetical protein
LFHETPTVQPAAEPPPPLGAGVPALEHAPRTTAALAAIPAILLSIMCFSPPLDTTHGRDVVLTLG